MVVTERSNSLSSLSTTRKTEEIVKGKSVKRASSFSSPRKEKQSSSPKLGSHERSNSKLMPRASSFSSSSSRKEKQSSSPKLSHERPNNINKSKLMPRASSFSSLPSPIRKARLVRGASALSTTTSNNVESPKRARKSFLKSKIKELGPICKKRKDVLGRGEYNDDSFEVCFGKQIDEVTMINPDDCFWLSSGSMSPQEFGLFMSELDPCMDEWVISFVPQNPNPRPPNTLKSEDKDVDVDVDVNVDEDEVREETVLQENNNSGFWNMDRTGVWVSLINLEGEDSKLISDEISGDDEGGMDSNFPSPNREVNWDDHSSDVGISSSARSTNSDWSSDLLSDSLDWDLDSEDPIFWPFGLESGWDPNLESFSVSPRKGTQQTQEQDSASPSPSPSPSTNSIKFRLHGANRETSKDGGMKRKILFVSGLSASKIIEFKKGYRKRMASSSKRSQIGKRVVGRRFSKRRVDPILETDLEGISPKETPTKEETQPDLVSFGSDMLSGSEDWADEMGGSDGPLVWPNDKKTDWNNVTYDFLNISPRKNIVSMTNFGSPKSRFTVSGSVRLKFRPHYKKSRKSKPGCHAYNTVSGLGTSRSRKFKPRSMSSKKFVVRMSMFKQSGVNVNHGISRMSANNGKRIRSMMPLNMGNGSEELIRMMLSAGSVNRRKLLLSPKGEVLMNSIETVMGLNEFDGHEGVDMDFEEGNFSFDECMKD